MRLTPTTAAAVTLPPGKSDVIVFDETLPGFGLRIREGGRRSWLLQYRAAGQQRRFLIGSADTLGADEARKAAKKLLARIELGEDPQADRKAARTRQERHQPETLGATVEAYLAAAAGWQRPRSLTETTRYLRTAWKPLHGRALGAVDRRAVAERVATLSRSSGPVAAARARMALSGLFVWAIGEGLCDANPVSGTNRPAEEVSRDRVLTPAELVAIWRACRDDDYGRCIRLLILTGQRREEVGGMLWTEIEGERWTLPPARTKNGRAHVVPLLPAMVAILPARGARPHVFGQGSGGFQGWSAAKAALDKRIAESGQTVARWRLHDIRRSVATGMADLGAPPHAVEAILNHASGTRGGIAAVYNKSAYANEKREVLTAWAAYVATLIGGDTVAIFGK